MNYHTIASFDTEIQTRKEVRLVGPTVAYPETHMVEKPEDYIYTYISPQKEEIVTSDLILTMISQDKIKAPSLYRSFVEEALSEEQEDPFKDLYAGMILGKKSFIKDTLSLLNPDSLRKDDTSSRRSLKTPVSMEEITEIISRAFAAHTQKQSSRSLRSG